MAQFLAGHPTGFSKKPAQSGLSLKCYVLPEECRAGEKAPEKCWCSFLKMINTPRDVFDGSIYHSATLPCYPFFKANAKAQTRKGARSLVTSWAESSASLARRLAGSTLRDGTNRSTRALHTLEACRTGPSHRAKTRARRESFSRFPFLKIQGWRTMTSHNGYFSDKHKNTGAPF